ncbi:hypothetical protein [Desulfobacter postgatei]|jgi:hypothetical protein|nr:hypothetical protein [Desulfobacter postgatei]MDX9963515.1 hypothetical protein [Desulfobacter postgatei]
MRLALEPVTQFAGCNWRINVGLLSVFATGFIKTRTEFEHARQAIA